jgi:hypothetical protein
VSVPSTLDRVSASRRRALLRALALLVLLDAGAATRLAAQQPPARVIEVTPRWHDRPGAVYDARRRRTVLFGGGRLEGTWEWTGRSRVR